MVIYMLVQVNLNLDNNVNTDDIEFKNLLIDMENEVWNDANNNVYEQKELIRTEICNQLSRRYELINDMQLIEDEDNKKFDCYVTVKEIDNEVILDALESLSKFMARI